MPSDSQLLAQAVARLNRRLRQERQSDLTAGQLAVMGTILGHQLATPSQIAAAERVSGPAITRTLNCLADQGYITRSPHPDDKRQVLISISEPGHVALEYERERRDAWLHARLQKLSVEERSQLRSATDLLNRIIEEEE